MTIKEFTEFYVDAYTSIFSDAELNELIDFYSSNLGQKADPTSIFKRYTKKSLKLNWKVGASIKEVGRKSEASLYLKNGSTLRSIQRFLMCSELI